MPRGDRRHALVRGWMEAAISDDPILAAIAALGADLHGEIVKTRTDIMERIGRHQARVDQLAQECFVNYTQGEAVHRRIDNTRGEQRDLAEQISGLVRQVRMLRDPGRSN